jgi:hypothetical protein
MIRQTLWAEFIIGGSLYFLSIIFFILLMCKKYDLRFFQEIKDLWPILSLLSLVFSYFFGYVVHRTINLFVSIFKKEKTLSNEETVILYQFGNESLIENINHQYKLIVTSRLLILGMIILGITSGLWLSNSQVSELSWSITITLILTGVISIFITLRQKKEYKELCREAVKLLKEDRNQKE